MARNNVNVLTPKFLDMLQARDINNLVYKNTGCFLFLTLPEEQLLYPKPMSAGGENYSYNIINLYKMYNDYGHFFLWFTIQKSQLPDNYMFDNSEMAEEMNILKTGQPRAAEHYAFVTRIARHVLTHGIFQQNSIINNPYIDPKIVTIEAIFEKVLSGKKWPDTESDWKKITRWLVGEADFLYDWIKQWATIWGGCKREKEDLKRRFYYGRWEYSTNRDKCKSTDEEAILLGNYKGSSYYIYEETNPELTSFSRVFPFQRIIDAKEYLAAAVSNCVRSQYESPSFWRSDRLEDNLRALYRNINFYGIENVRRQMYHPSRPPMVCPDAFKLYLEGLTNKMVTLPIIEPKPQSSSRFRRK